MINENARTAQNQEDYMKCYNALVSRYDKAKAHLNEVEKNNTIPKGGAAVDWNGETQTAVITN